MDLTPKIGFAAYCLLGIAIFEGDRTALRASQHNRVAGMRRQRLVVLVADLIDLAAKHEHILSLAVEARSVMLTIVCLPPHMLSLIRPATSAVRQDSRRTLSRLGPPNTQPCASGSSYWRTRVDTVTPERRPAQCCRSWRLVASFETRGYASIRA